MTADKNNELILQGISGSPGICIGKAYLVDKEGVDVVEKYYISQAAVGKEKTRFKIAVKKAIDELREIIDDTPAEYRQHAHILETHLVLLKDKKLNDKTIEIIENERVNAEWALKKMVSEIKPVFEKMSASYLKERADDIVQVADRVMMNLTGADPEDISTISKRVVLVAQDLSPAETSQIQLEKIKGFVTDKGGITSHTGIIARSLGIPAVLGLEKATILVKNDDIIIVDGSSGQLVINPSEQTLIEFEDRKDRYNQYKAEIAQDSYLPAITIDNIKISVQGNIELPEEVVAVLDNGGEGIGLYRTEFQYLSRATFPGENELFNKYREVVEVMGERPVTIRTLDINGDKAITGVVDSEEANPVLGLRAIRYCLKNQDVFKTQLRAILRAAAFGRVRLLLPLICSMSEVIATRKILKEVTDSLDKDGIEYGREIEVGIMIEVPSAVIMADQLANEVDFFSIGTNDLFQYTMAIDRGNRHVAHMYKPLQPVIIRMLHHVIRAAQKANIEVSICGEMAGDPFNTPILLGLGFKDLSMNPQSIPAVKSILRSLDFSETKQFVAKVLEQTATSAIIELINNNYGSILKDKTYKG